MLVRLVRNPLLVIALLALAVGCSSGSNFGPTVDDRGGEDTGDTGSDVGGDVGDDADGDASSDDADTAEDAADADPDGDADGEDDVVELVPCDRDDDCDEDAICVAETCRSLRCSGPEDWVRCQDLFNELERDLGRYATCTERQCRVACLLDDDCDDGQICTDFGYCREFGGDLSIEHPAGPATGLLQAGFSNLLMNYPLGVPLGGYGQRAAGNDGRYAVSLKASVGQLHGLYIRTAVIDNGERRMMIMRIPIIFTSMALHEELAQALQERTGQDWRHSLIISSTHTHSGPCRHWHLPPEAAAPLGAFGIGEFSQFFYDVLRDSVLEAAFAALDDMAPARIGWTIVESYDVDDQVANDRWEQTPPFDDNRTLLIRIDDHEGVPRGVLFSFGAHGTENDEDYLSGDALVGAERVLEERLGQEYGRYVPALFINQNSGTMGPATGARGHAFPQNLTRLGWAFVEKIWDRFEAIETTNELTLTSRNLRFPISYDTLEYGRDEFFGTIPPPFGGEYRYGGLSCTGRFGGDRDFETHDSLDNVQCAGALHFLLFNAPPTTLTRSQLMAFELNGLTVLTVPGEVSQELSWEMTRAIRDEFGVDPMRMFTWGYANDHLFYLLPTNLRGELPPYPGLSTPQPLDDYPDFAFSYFQGGYEATMSMWGPTLGDYLVERGLEVYGSMLDPDRPVAFDEPLPSEYADRDEEPFPTDITPEDEIGRIVEDVPAEIRRFDVVEFAWVGGDPAAEAPQTPVVTLEREVDGAFEPVVLPSYREYTNLELLFITRLRQPETHWEWVVRWEETKAFPAGRYRFRVDGHYFATEGDDGRRPYQVLSREFDLVPTDAVLIEVGTDAGAIVGTLGYPPEERARFGGPGTDPGLVTGTYRLRHPMVPTGVASPLEVGEDADITGDGVTVTISDGGDEVAVFTGDDVDVTTTPEAISGHADVPVTRYSIDFGELSGTFSVGVTVEDLHGNTGSSLTDLTLP